MKRATKEYKESKSLEEGIPLLEGVVVAHTMDGDIVIMAGKKIIRYCHEDWSIWDEWPDAETFLEEIVEAYIMNC